MSVRNQYARNYYKIGPLPQTSLQIENARNAVRRRNLYDEENKGQVTASNYNSFNVEGKIKNRQDISGMKDKSNENYVDLKPKQGDPNSRNKGVKVHGNTDFGKPRASYFKNRVRNASDESVNVSQQPVKGFKDNKASILRLNANTVNDTSSHRPQSARPDSRWQRRPTEDVLEDEVFEDDKISIEKTHKEYSGADKQGQLESISVQSRPKTSHGRRKSGSNLKKTQSEGDSGSKIPRPVSRKKNSKKKSSSSKSSPLSSQMNVSSPQNNTGNEVIHSDLDYSIGIATFYPEVIENIHRVDDIKLQIEEIDQSVDPVVYFMTDYDSATKTSHTDKKRPFLSKDAIKLITTDKSSQQTIPQMGFQGNGENKQSSGAELIDRFQGNRFQSLQNTITDSNQAYFHGNKRQEWNRRDPYRSDSGHSEDLRFRLSRTQNNTLELVSSTSRLLTNQDTPGGAHLYVGNIKPTLPNPTNTVNRKPRRLKPLMSPYMEE